MKMLFSNIMVLATVKVILCQVTKNIDYLQDKFFNDHTGLSWFIMSKMKHNAKFLLCVDVYQKIEKKRMMEGRYITNEEYTMSLPEFKLDNVTVAGINKHSGRSKLVTSLHCPFSKIAFEKNSYTYGTDFYLSARANKFCVYILTRFHNYPNKNMTMYINGKVCNVMADIRKNQGELEAELISHPNIHLIREQEWKPLFLQDNQLRYLTCMDVYGKIEGSHLCNYRVNGELPIFERVGLTLQLTTGTRKLSAILCPMHKMTFVKRALTILSPYYLAPSINKGCAYKLAHINSSYTSYSTDESAVYIQEEICGIFEPVRNDIQQLEQEFLHTWNDVVHLPNNETVPWPDLSYLEYSLSDVLKICENIYLKIHHTSLYRDKSLSMKKPKELVLHLQTMTREARKIWGVYCPMHLINNDMGDIQPYYITNSVNIGCVYVLFSKMRQVSTIIQYEVCGVYPISYLFNI